MKKVFYIFVFFASFFSVKAQPGSLDPTFGVGGKVNSIIGAASSEIRGVAIQADGKILVVGIANNGLNTDFAIARYLSDGNLDNTFDSDGTVLTDFNGFNDEATSIVLQPDGKILVCGNAYNTSSNPDFALARYNIDGSLDITFNTTGKAITTIGGSIDISLAMTLQTDGKIILAGYSYNGSNNNFAVVRYNADGTLDLTFSFDGKVTTDFSGNSDVGRAIALKSDGKIIVAGNTSVSSPDVALARYNTNGTLDNTFDTDGKVITDIGILGTGEGVAVQLDGKIIVVGQTYSFTSSNENWVTLRYNDNGSLDNTFDSDGILSHEMGTMDDRASAVCLQSDGKILVAGYGRSSDYDFSIARYNPNGSFDLTFDTDGKIMTDFSVGSNDCATAMAFQNDGKIIVAGSTDNGIDTTFAIARYFISAVGISENDGERIISIFPNPTNTKLYLSSKKNLSNASLKITNSTGQLIFTQQNLSGNNFTIDVSTFANGIYFLEMSDGEIVSRTKFIKE